MSFTFNGTSQYLTDSASVIQGVASQAIVIWFRADSTGGTAHKCLFSCQARATSKKTSYQRELQIGHNEYISGPPPASSKIRVYVQLDDSAGTSVIYSPQLDWSSSQWYVAIVDFSGATSRDVYIADLGDETSEVSTNDTSSWTYAANGFVEGTEVGRSVKNSNRYFDGAIAGICAINSALVNTSVMRSSLIRGLWGLPQDPGNVNDGNADIALYDFDSQIYGSLSMLLDWKGRTSEYDLSTGGGAGVDTTEGVLLNTHSHSLGLSY